MPKIRNTVVLFILVILNLLIASFFLFNQASGSDSALKAMVLDDAYIHFVYAENLAE